MWRVPTPVPPASHTFKHRLVYVVDGVRVIGFDNERRKGDYRHGAGVESASRFEGVDRLLADFVETAETWRTTDGQG